MNAASLQRLQKTGSRLRQNLFGRTADGETQMAQMDVEDSRQFPCYFSFRPSQESLFDAGFRDQHEGIVFVAKTEKNCTAIIGKRIRIIAAADDGSDIVVTINEIPPVPNNVEWAMGVGSQP